MHGYIKCDTYVYLIFKFLYLEAIFWYSIWLIQAEFDWVQTGMLRYIQHNSDLLGTYSLEQKYSYRYNYKTEQWDKWYVNVHTINSIEIHVWYKNIRLQ